MRTEIKRGWNKLKRRSLREITQTSDRKARLGHSKMSHTSLKMIPSSKGNFSWNIIKNKMPAKSPNHYGDRGRQTAADAAGRAANCSCNWTYFTRASENLAGPTGCSCTLSPSPLSLVTLFLLLYVLLSLTLTAIIGGCFFFTLSRNPGEPWSWPTCNYSIFRVSSKRHREPRDMAWSRISKNGLSEVE